MPLALPVPDLVSLDLLQSVAEFGSIRRAAQAHGISQPAASVRLRSLERIVGLELLDRSTGRARLTPSGRAVVQWSEPILDGVRTLLVGTAALHMEASIQLRLVASMTVAEYLVPVWLNRLRVVDPELRVSLQMGNSEQVTELVKRGQADLGFVEGRAVLPGLDTQVVESDDLVVVVAPSHPWVKRRQPLSAAQLACTPLVLREVGSGTREVLETELGQLGLTVTPLVELGSTTAIKAAIASGVEAAVLSRLATQGDVKDGRLVIVPVAGLSLDRSIRAIWVPSLPLSNPAKLLLAQLTTSRSETTESKPDGDLRGSGHHHVGPAGVIASKPRG